jgi:hypothetical protein
MNIMEQVSELARKAVEEQNERLEKELKATLEIIRKRNLDITMKIMNTVMPILAEVNSRESLVQVYTALLDLADFTSKLMNEGGIYPGEIEDLSQKSLLARIRSGILDLGQDGAPKKN